ncbi:competence protein [Peribacillus loiseleuriae]|uniref:Competence protein n=1 Tax=Peribacillus loiseleuriae TaxID=1679170 RepID=A0A0K9GW46_9BACI|nr:late competence protein ComER [Peribacillus loiseleuriae]KMY50870.1 competence protein [Peribacillus loiseleuriae]
MKIGVIGTGNMGTVLLESWLEAKAITEVDLIITNRTLTKALAIQYHYKGVTVVNTAADVARNADAIFVCVKPLEVLRVLQTIKPYINEDKCVISITSPISVDQLESQLDCSCARFIPSITNRALSGVSLLSFGSQCQSVWKETITALANSMSEAVIIENEITRAASDIVSCGPAFFTYLARKFIDGAVQTTKIDEKTASVLTENMLIGLGDLLRKGIYTLPTLQDKVCVKGGITGEGIKILEAETGEMFEQLFKATNEKFTEDIEEVEKQFRTPY